MCARIEVCVTRVVEFVLLEYMCRIGSAHSDVDCLPTASAITITHPIGRSLGRSLVAIQVQYVTWDCDHTAGPAVRKSDIG